MISQAQLKAQYKYDKDHTRQVGLKFNVSSDSDVLAKLESMPNRQGYIKELIRKDMREGSDVLSIESIRYLLLPIVKKYKIESLSIFGSYARNEATCASDVDILIDGGNFEGLIGYMNVLDDMKKSLGKDVDLVTKNSLYESKNESDLIFLQNIEKEKVVLI